jgi:hypothetical protein
MPIHVPVVSRAGANLKRLLGEPKAMAIMTYKLKVARNNLLLQN